MVSELTASAWSTFLELSNRGKLRRAIIHVVVRRCAASVMSRDTSDKLISLALAVTSALATTMLRYLELFFFLVHETFLLNRLHPLSEVVKEVFL